MLDEKLVRKNEGSENAAGKVTILFMRGSDTGAPQADEQPHSVDDAEPIPPGFLGFAVGTQETAKNPEFQTMEELYRELERPIEWLWHGLIEKGDLVILPAEAKAGKTTLLGPLVASIVKGEAFLDRPITKSKVVFASEEAPKNIARRFKKLGIDHTEPDLKRIKHLNFPEHNEIITQMCLAEGAEVLLIDTLATFFNVENENDNRMMQVALRPLQDFAHENNVTIIIAHHSPANTGKGRKPIRGATAIFAAVDQSIHLRRPDQNETKAIKNDHPAVKVANCRLLEIKGRHAGEGPDSITVELVGQPQLSNLKALYTYRRVSEHWDHPEMKLLANVPYTGHGLTAEELFGLVGGDRTRLFGELPKLVAAGEIEKLGNGGKGNPFRYRRVREDPGNDKSAEDDSVCDEQAAPVSAALSS